MSNFFSFLKELGYEDMHIARLNLRWDHIIKPFQSDILGHRVLDLASHDGRWPYAFSAAGAREVIGIEGRPELVDQFKHFPDSEVKNRVSLIAGDMFDFCRQLTNRNEKFGVVGVLGIFYHIMSHYDLLVMLRKMDAKLIILDSTFIDEQAAVIRICTELTARKFNAIAQTEGQVKEPIGVPSIPALRIMANALGYNIESVDWTDVPAGERRPVWDYFRNRRNRRFTFALRAR